MKSEKRTSSTPRRGRLPDAERNRRRNEVLAAASAELVESGYDKSTMLSVARRAGASKETLYAWFGSKEGLFAELIAMNADATAERIRAALDDTVDVAATLEGFGAGLLSLLVSPESIALNRSAMHSPALAVELLASGRFRVGPLVEEYLTRLDERGAVAIADAAEAFEVLYGLVIRDTQIRVLLGEQPPTRTAIEARARTAVVHFLELYAP